MGPVNVTEQQIQTSSLLTNREDKRRQKLYFPFLTCEVKCGASALDVVDHHQKKKQAVFSILSH